MKKIIILCLVLASFSFANQKSDALQKACDKGNMKSCADLGIAYDLGRGVRQNYSKARKLYKKACDKNNMNACFNLGILYDNGKGVRQNYSKARKLYKKACDGGGMLQLVTI